MSSPTEKQLESIRKIEGILNIKFKGQTSKEAWLFINKYLQKSIDKAVSNYYNNLLERELIRKHRRGEL